ncbi:MAG: transcriptional regulator PpsR [Gammaproteobacteria bacterium]
MTSDTDNAQPDVTLVLDLDGVIQEVTHSAAIPAFDYADWIGRAWSETVADVGADKVRRLIDDASAQGVSAFRQVNQKFPGGAEILMEYTAVRLGDRASLIAVGKSLQAVAQLQERLVAAQQAMERDYWKLRQVETRYQRLFQSSSEAVLVVSQPDCRIIEANPAAARALDPDGTRGAGANGVSLLEALAPDEQRALQALLLRVLEQGAAPGIVVHLGPERTSWMLRAAPMTTERGQGYLLQMTAGRSGDAVRNDAPQAYSVEALIERAADAFVITDRDGVVLHANPAFAELVQLSAASAALGKRLSHWLGNPGPDAGVLLANAFRHGCVRLLATTVHGEFAATADVEISAVVDDPAAPRCCALVMRDVGRRLPTRGDDSGLGAVLSALTEQIGKKGLKALVGETVAAVERHYVEAALELTDGNRTAAADLLGVSRQSLYAKLNRYGLDATIPARKASLDEG